MILNYNEAGHLGQKNISISLEHSGILADILFLSLDLKSRRPSREKTLKIIILKKDLLRFAENEYVWLDFRA